MEIKLKGREMPRGAGGDVKFVILDAVPPRSATALDHPELLNRGVLDIFTPDEVVELVNRALYQLEYQRESHRKRGQAERDKMKALKEALKATGKDAKATRIERELKGE